MKKRQVHMQSALCADYVGNIILVDVLDGAMRLCNFFAISHGKGGSVDDTGPP